MTQSQYILHSTENFKKYYDSDSSILHVTVRQSNDRKLGKDKVGRNSLGRASQP